MKKLILLSIMLLSSHACFAVRIVTDELGRSVSLPDHPQRLICLTPNAADSVYALGAGSNVLAVSDYTNFPAEARSKPSVGTPMTPSLERIVALHPDLVIGSGSFSVQTAERLKSFGISVFLIDPHGIEGIFRSLQNLGKALNREAQARLAVARFRGRVRAVRSRVGGKPRQPVFMLIWHDPVTTVGRGAFITELIEIAGGRSMTSDLSQEWPQIGFETVVARAPEAILLVRGSKMALDDLVKHPQWRTIPAVRNHKLYYTDERLYLASPSAVDALEDLAKQFHP